MGRGWAGWAEPELQVMAGVIAPTRHPALRAASADLSVSAPPFARAGSGAGEKGDVDPVSGPLWGENSNPACGARTESSLTQPLTPSSPLH